MSRHCCNDYHCNSRHRSRRRYGCMSFIFDLFMLVVTGGLWLVWIFIREMRAR